MFPKVTKTLLTASLLSVTFFTNAQPGKLQGTGPWKGLAQRSVLQKRSLFDSIPFRNIGPSIMSGRVDDIDVNPADPTEFYVAYATGGLWYTHNNGQSFTPLFDSADVIGIGDIAVNWKTGTIWVGTGEVNSSRSSYAGIGMYRSTDKGRSWSYIGLPESHHIGKIQLHPTDDNTAWVAVLGHLYTPNHDRGVYKTTDAGATWKQTLYVDDNTGAVDLDINPANPAELYASTWYRTRTASSFVPSGKTSGLYKSADGGETWTRISTPASGFLQGDVVGRIGLAVYPKNPQVVYAVVDNQASRPDTTKGDTSKYVLEAFKNLSADQFASLNDPKLDSFLKRNGMNRRYTAKAIKDMVATGQLKPTAIYDYLYQNTGFEGTPYGAEIYRSDDGGRSWRKMNNKPLSTFSTYGYYFGKIFVSPVNDQKLVITGFTIDLSTDGGRTFKSIGKENVHADHHVAWIDPARDSHIFSGNDGGLNFSYDDGAHWFKANTPSVGQFYSVVVDNAKPYNVYGGLQDNGVWTGPSTNRENVGWHDDGNYPFKSIMGGDGMQVAVDPRDNMTTYTGFQFGAYSRLNRLNSRESAKRITPQHSLGERPIRFNWQTPVILSAHNPDIVYFGGNRLFRSFNKADTMVAISPDLTKGDGGGNVPYGTITTIAESPVRYSLLYVGTDDGNIQASKDGGSTWTLVSAAPKKGFALPQGLWVSRLTASRYKEPRVYASLSGYRKDDFNAYLYVSEDYGATWAPLGKDLPTEPINVVREDPKNENILYVGTDGGLYVSFDRGQSFMAWNAGLPRSIPVHDIAIQARDNEIVLGTHGRSLYVSKLDDIQGLFADRDWMKKKPKPKEEPRRRSDDGQAEGESEPD
ncbi:MAG: glycosyl hydrolase [Flaviaesturariibacter sp.]|nr:glycosyl hydrolase [Flaviaesturariibacter sp.]